MARPAKNNLDYFPMECVMNDRYRLLEAEHGMAGYCIPVKLLQRIYGGEGYYMVWNDDVAMLFSVENRIDIDDVKKVVASALVRGVFDEGIYKKYGILTSLEIQKKYFFATTKRIRENVDKRYILADPDGNVEKEGVSVTETPQKKEKEKKRKETSKKECAEKKAHSPAPAEKYGKYDNVYLTEEEYTCLQSEYGDWQGMIDNLSEYIEMTGRKYKSHYATLKRWARKDMEMARGGADAGGHTDQTAGRTLSTAYRDTPNYDIEEFADASYRHTQQMYNTTGASP